MFDLSHGSGKPTCFLLRTTKGLGVSYMETPSIGTARPPTTRNTPRL
mgnify:FL=1